MPSVHDLVLGAVTLGRQHTHVFGHLLNTPTLAPPSRVSYRDLSYGIFPPTETPGDKRKIARNPKQCGVTPTAPLSFFDGVLYRNRLSRAYALALSFASSFSASMYSTEESPGVIQRSLFASSTDTCRHKN